MCSATSVSAGEKTWQNVQTYISLLKLAPDEFNLEVMEAELGEFKLLSLMLSERIMKFNDPITSSDCFDDTTKVELTSVD